MTNSIEGQRFGRWTAIEMTDLRGVAGRRLWLCRCDCGTERPVNPGNLKRGLTSSCGCWRKERMAAIGRSSHGKAEGEPVTYSGAHNRVKRLRGSASTHPCADCSGPARDWSLSAKARSVIVGPTP